ncbi:hypothetical protein J4558_10210 [Leptolyngbya sp. 15MV]|nr:hypothetical protein J4558_10210 [Leptolyngbya sp. 15MV]
MRVQTLLVLAFMAFASLGTHRSFGQATPVPLTADEAFIIANGLSGIPRADFDRQPWTISQFELSAAMQASSMRVLSATQSALRAPTDGLLLEFLIANDTPGMRPESLEPLGTGPTLIEAAARHLFMRPREAEPPVGSWIDLSRSGFRWIVRQGSGFAYIDLVGDQAAVLRREARALARSSDFRNSILSVSFFLHDPDAENPASVVSCTEYAERLVSQQLSDFTNRANAIRSIYCGTPDVVAAEARLRAVVDSISSAVEQGRSRSNLATGVEGLIERHTSTMRTLHALVTVCEGNRAAVAGDTQCGEVLEYIRAQLAVMESEATAKLASLRPSVSQGRWALHLFRLAEDHATAISALVTAARPEP